MAHHILHSLLGSVVQAAPVLTVPVAPAPIVIAPVIRPAPSVQAVVAPAAAGAKTAPAVRARAVAPLPTLFSTDDYPQAALRAQEQGTGAFRLTIGGEGRVTQCAITGSSGSAALDSGTCLILQRRARFTPARDAQHRAVEDHFDGRIKWTLPPQMPLAYSGRFQRLVLTIDGAGRPVGCRGEQEPAGPPPPPPMCEMGKMIAARIIAASGDDADFRNRELVIENGLRVDGSDALLKIGRRDGEHLLSLTAFELEVDASGLVTHCNSADGFAKCAMSRQAVRGSSSAGSCPRPRSACATPLFMTPASRAADVKREDAARAGRKGRGRLSLPTTNR